MSQPGEQTFAERYGPWALIAGASEGIGASFAHQVAAAGVNVVLVARRAEPLEQTAAAIRAEFGVETRTLTVDLTSDDLIGQLDAVTGGLDIGLFVYNAGATHGAIRFHDDGVEMPLRLVRLNCVGPVVLCHHYGARMLERGRGGIILLTSMSAVAGAARTVTYSATKAFDQVFAEGLWAELHPRGIDVLALIAGATRTPAMERSGALIGGEAFPGMAPDDVASEGLANIANGPTWVAGDANRAGYEYMRSLPRADVVALMSQGARAIYGLPDEP
jgi:short-subunit dehydrogenase